MGKWIGGFLGLMAAGPLGAIAGFVLGSLFDKSTEPAELEGDGTQTQQQVYEGQRNTFRFSLLVLASYIIRADGRVMHSEMNVVRSFLRNNFGEAAVSEGEQILLKLFDQQKRLGMGATPRTASLPGYYRSGRRRGVSRRGECPTRVRCGIGHGSIRSRQHA